MEKTQFIFTKDIDTANILIDKGFQLINNMDGFLFMNNMSMNFNEIDMKKVVFTNQMFL